MCLTSSICFSSLVEFWSQDNGLFDYLCLAHEAWLGLVGPGNGFATLFSEQDKTVSLLGASHSLTALTLVAVAHW